MRLSPVICRSDDKRDEKADADKKGNREMRDHGDEEGRKGRRR